jgi:oligopeptidase A
METAKNPFLSESWMPDYAAMTPEQCAAVLEESIPRAERAFKVVEKQLDISWRGLVQAPAEAVRVPFETWGILCHLTSVISNDEWRAVEERFQPAIIALSQTVSQSKALYEGMLSLLEQDKKLKPWQRHILDSNIRSMRLSGVGLTGAERRKFNKIGAELGKLSMKFSNNVLDSERESKVEIAVDAAAGIPEDLLQGKGPWTLGIDFATYDAVMRYAESSDVRERFWRMRCTRASSGKTNNAPLIEKILKLRQQMAEMLGMPDYAHLSTASKMAGTPENVFNLHDPMVAVGKPVAKE